MLPLSRSASSRCYSYFEGACSSQCYHDICIELLARKNCKWGSHSCSWIEELVVCLGLASPAYVYIFHNHRFWAFETSICWLIHLLSNDWMNLFWEYYEANLNFDRSWKICISFFDCGHLWWKNPSSNLQPRSIARLLVFTLILSSYHEIFYFLFLNLFWSRCYFDLRVWLLVAGPLAHPLSGFRFCVWDLICSQIPFFWSISYESADLLCDQVLIIFC